MRAEYSTLASPRRGLVMIACGMDSSGNNILTRAELYNFATRTLTSTGRLNTARDQHTATLLNSGMALIAGGNGCNGSGCTPAPLSSAELSGLIAVGLGLYTPGFTYTPSELVGLNVPRYFHTATLLNSGMVLLAGGVCDTSGDLTSTAELY